MGNALAAKMVKVYDLEAHEIHPQIPLQAGSSADVFAKIKTSLGCRDGPKEA
jgi:hypothetical protein